MVDTSFLRSINIQLDVGHPERFEHFRPTSKSVHLVSSLLDKTSGNALFVVAPYGSGKSITAGYLGELVENRAQAASMLDVVGKRIEPVDPSVAEVAHARREGGTRGLFVPLYGHVPSAPAALKDGLLGAMRRCKLGREARALERLPAENARDVFELIGSCSEKLEAQGFDRLVIVWDEFGRHLQGLISEGRPEELDVLQLLAEVVSRTSSLPVSLVLLLHRSLLGYAGGLPSGVRREWAKIEGRFDTLQYVDDSSEMYDLIGSLVRDSRTVEPDELDTEQLAARAKEVGLFPRRGGGPPRRHLVRRVPAGANDPAFAAAHRRPRSSKRTDAVLVPAVGIPRRVGSTGHYLRLFPRRLSGRWRCRGNATSLA